MKWVDSIGGTCSQFGDVLIWRFGDADSLQISRMILLIVRHIIKVIVKIEIGISKSSHLQISKSHFP